MLPIFLINSKSLYVRFCSRFNGFGGIERRFATQAIRPKLFISSEALFKSETLSRLARGDSAYSRCEIVMRSDRPFLNIFAPTLPFI
jgi:hypothetical protein